MFKFVDQCALISEITPELPATFMGTYCCIMRKIPAALKTAARPFLYLLTLNLLI